MHRSFLSLTACSLFLISCSQSTKEFTIRTSPSGADIFINGERVEGKSPLTTKVDQNKELAIVAIKPGYEVKSENIPTMTSFWKSLIWTQNDPLAQYIEQDSVVMPLNKLQSTEDYRASDIPKFCPPKPLDLDPIIKLRKLPKGL